MNEVGVKVNPRSSKACPCPVSAIGQKAWWRSGSSPTAPQRRMAQMQRQICLYITYICDHHSVIRSHTDEAVTLAHLSLIPWFFSIPSSLSSAAETRASPWSMPLWSRSCCTSPAWPPLPRSWQNLKLSREVFANQDLIKSQGRKGKFARHFSTEVCWVKRDYFSVSLSSLLDSFHQRPDRRGRRWVDRVFTTASKDSLCWNRCNTDSSFYCWCELFMRNCDGKNPPRNGSLLTLCRKTLVLSRGRSLYDDLKTNSILHMREHLIFKTAVVSEVKMWWVITEDVCVFVLLQSSRTNCGKSFSTEKPQRREMLEVSPLPSPKTWRWGNGISFIFYFGLH